jgi:hypothetical protein
MSVSCNDRCCGGGCLSAPNWRWQQLRQLDDDVEWGVLEKYHVLFPGRGEIDLRLRGPTHSDARRSVDVFTPISPLAEIGQCRRGA